MKIVEREAKVMDLRDECWLVNFISADFVMRGFINEAIDKQYSMKEKLSKFYGYGFIRNRTYGTVMLKPCLVVDNVFNLVTKLKQADNVRMESLCNCFVSMRQAAYELGAKRIAIQPNFQWADGVRYDVMIQMLMDIFCRTDIELIICRKAG